MAGKQADIKVGVITNYEDKGLKQAQTGLAGFKSSIAEADGVGNKFKAGWGSVTDSVKANAGLMGVAAGGALVAFGLKAVHAFTDTAKAAIDLGTATGLSVEQASRWIAVGDDFEVSAEALQTGLGKIAKTMDDVKWKKYGIETRDAGGAARSTNDILLDSFDTLSRITNETERARIGQELFGKGYQSITPILGKTRAEYEKMLGTVEKGQVITAEEAKKAEKFRLAEDQLGDALQDVTIAIGEQVAGLSPLLVSLAKLIGLMAQLPDEFLDFGGAGDVIDTLYALRGEADKGGKSWEAWRKEVLEGKISLDEAVIAIHAAADAQKELDGGLRQGEKSWETQTEWLDKAAIAAGETDRETRRLTEGMKGGTLAFEAAKKPIDNASRALEEFRTTIAGVDQAYRGLTDKLDEEEAWENVNEAIKEFGKGTKATDEEVRNITRDIADYVVHTDTIPAEKKTNILALLDEGKLAEAKMVLADVTRNRDIYLNLIARGSGDIIAKLGKLGYSATGGRIPMNEGMTLVGEQGPELISSPGSMVYPAKKTASMLNGNGNGGGGNTYNVTLAMPVIASQADFYRAGQTITAAIAEFERRRGF